mmetsp:Transcript_9831/g.14494  ORF Transcript_9831/g.14494 Transcript_9831/m.14494 type:complete len:471 (-) Transcript_9831:144-1556(-)
MNKKLLAHGNVQDYLEAIPDTLHSIIKGRALNFNVTSMKYSDCGNYLAVGLHNGEVRIYDVDSREWVRIIIGGHDIIETQIRLVADIIWLKSLDNESNVQNYRIVTASNYQPNIFIWDCEEKKMIKSFNFKNMTDFGIRYLDSHPSNPFMFIVTPLYTEPYLIVDYRTNEIIKIDIKDSEDETLYKKQPYTIARFNETGDSIFVANGKKKKIHKFNLIKKDYVSSPQETPVEFTFEKNINNLSRSYDLCHSDDIELSQNASILDIKFSLKGNFFAVNTEHSIIIYRKIDGFYVFGHEISDPVEKSLLSHPRFIHNYLLDDVDEVLVYVSNGTDLCYENLATSKLIKTVHRPQILDTAVNPTKSLLATSSKNLDVLFYTAYIEQNWSCLEPNFSEIRTNVQYIEREDELDLLPNGLPPSSQKDQNPKFKPCHLSEEIDIFGGDFIKKIPKPLSVYNHLSDLNPTSFPHQKK